MAEQHAPWLSPDSRAWAARIRRSHSHAFRRPLLANRHNCSPNARVSCQELFAAPWPVLAHNDSSDPALVYANAAALKLWQRRWAQMVGMPSRLTAPEKERRERAQALGNARQQDAYQGYSGIRIDSQGHRFVINNARIWTLWDLNGHRCGQAATFASWHWL